MRKSQPSRNNLSATRVSTTSLLLILTIPLLAACGSTMPLREPTTRDIPGPPKYLQPAAIPPAKAGSSPYVVAEKRKQVIVNQNRVIVGARNAWTNMKTTYQNSFVKKNIFGR